MGRRRRLVALIGAVAVVGSLLVVVPAVGQESEPEPEVVRLVLGSGAPRFEYGSLDPQMITTARNGCEINQGDERIVNLSPDGTRTPVPGFSTSSIGIKSSGSNSNGTPCSQISGPEVLTIRPGSALSGRAFSEVRLDLEMTGNAIVSLTFHRVVGGPVEYLLYTGTNTSVLCDARPDAPGCDGDGNSLTSPYEVVVGPGQLESACASPQGSGPNSGANDNCIWSVDPGIESGAIDLKVKDVGTVSLEGGSDTGIETLFYLAEQKGSISGQKWRDHDNDGARDDFEAGMSGWTIRAYPSGFTTVAGSAVTATDGNYTISDLPYGTYLVCEFPPVVPDEPDYFTWYQSTPGDSTGACSDVEGAEPDGWVVTVDGDEVGADFFNVRTLTLIDDPGTLELDCLNLPIDEETGLGFIQTIESGQPLGRIEIDPDNCKPGEYVFETYVLTVGGQFEQVADFYPLFETTETMPIVEDYRWLPLSNSQLILRYDDIAPYDDLQPMLFCALPEELLWSYQGELTDFLPEGETSCLFETSETIVQVGVDDQNNPLYGVQRTDRVFTLIDGKRTLR
jgi:hypothetical protein